MKSGDFFFKNRYVALLGINKCTFLGIQEVHVTTKSLCTGDHVQNKQKKGRGTCQLKLLRSNKVSESLKDVQLLVLYHLSISLEN